jgi:hypothetical protein
VAKSAKALRRRRLWRWYACDPLLDQWPLALQHKNRANDLLRRRAPRTRHRSPPPRAHEASTAAFAILPGALVPSFRSPSPRARRAVETLGLRWGSVKPCSRRRGAVSCLRAAREDMTTPFECEYDRPEISTGLSASWAGSTRARKPCGVSRSLGPPSGRLPPARRGST